MEDHVPHEKTVAEMLAKLLVEVADGNAFLLTLIDLQARLVAAAEGRALDEVVDEVDALLKANRRAAIQDVEEWATGTRTPIEDE